MKKALLLILALVTAALCMAQDGENRIKPNKNILQAPGANYILLSDGPGNFQIVPASSIPGGAGDSLVSVTYNGDQLTITTTGEVFNVNINAGTVETTAPININGTVFPSGTDIQTILDAIGTAIDNIDMTDNGDGTYTFTDTDGTQVTLIGSGTASFGTYVYKLAPGENYTLPADTLLKYDFLFFYAESVPGPPVDTSVVIFPEVSSAAASYLGKNLYVYADGDATLPNTQAPVVIRTPDPPDDPGSDSDITHTDCYGTGTISAWDTLFSSVNYQRIVRYTTVPSGEFSNYHRECIGSNTSSVDIIASNGLNKTGNDVELGGTLQKNTDVDNQSFLFRVGDLSGWSRSFWTQNAAASQFDFRVNQQRDSTDATQGFDEASVTLNPGEAQLEVDRYPGLVGDGIERAFQINFGNIVGEENWLSLKNFSPSNSANIFLETSNIRFDATNNIQVNPDNLIYFYDDAYYFPRPAPGAGNRVQVWVNGVPEWQDQSAGGGASMAQDNLASGTFTADVDRLGGSAIVLTNPAAGNYDLEVPAGAYFDGARVFANNTTLNASQELVLIIDNAANSNNRTFTVQLYDASNNALVDQQATGTNHTQAVSGNITTITIPGANGFGSNGFYVELR